MSLKIWPFTSLSTPCKPVQNFADLPVLLEEMKSTMLAERGLGIAANQLGYNLSIFLLKSKNDIIEIINPEIISEEGEQFEDEGCLSFKNLFTRIKRPMQIHFKYVTRDNEPKEAIVYGKEAQCFAHEIDHLLGRTILDHANRSERKRILKELENVK
jgi:peptide deformylase